MPRTSEQSAICEEVTDKLTGEYGLLVPGEVVSLYDDRLRRCQSGMQPFGVLTEISVHNYFDTGPTVVVRVDLDSNGLIRILSYNRHHPMFEKLVRSIPGVNG